MEKEVTTVERDPVRGMVELRDTISGLFEDFFHSRPLLAARQHRAADTGYDWMPPVDIRETDDEVVAYAALPGVAKEDIQLEVKDGTLVLTGRRAERGAGRWLRREIATGQFYRAFTLPAEVKAAEVTASSKDGVLEIRLPKAEQAKPHKVTVK